MTRHNRLRLGFAHHCRRASLSPERECMYFGGYGGWGQEAHEAISFVAQKLSKQTYSPVYANVSMYSRLGIL